MKSDKNKKMLINLPLETHELTFSCNKGMNLLSKERACIWLKYAIEKARRDTEFSLMAYVFMPNHVHLIIQAGKREYNISKILQRIKQSVSKKAKFWLDKNEPAWVEKLTVRKKNGQKVFRFWQKGGGYDRNISQANTLRKMIDYLHMNPIRAALVENATDWKWSSAGWYYEGKEGPLSIDEMEI